MKILRIIARLNVGGPAIQAINLTGALSSGSFNSRLICGKVSSFEGDMEYLAREINVKPFFIPQLGRDISTFSDLKAFFALRKNIRQFRPDIVHTHTAKAGALGRLAVMSVNISTLPRERIHVVHTFHGHIFHGYFSPIKSAVFRLIERALAYTTDRIIVISSLQKDDICRRFGIAREKKVSVIPLGFDLSTFYEKNKEENETERNRINSRAINKSFIIGIVGRLTEIKNHGLLLKALNILKQRGKIENFRCLIIGDGELRDNLEKMTEDLNLGDFVNFTGWRKTMSSVYNELDAVVLTSKNEGTPVVLIEAMASGKPVIATDVGGVRDLIGKSFKNMPGGFRLAEKGIYITPDDPEGLANAIFFLNRNRAKGEDMAKKSRDFVLKEYSFDRLLYDIKKLYKELVVAENV